MFNNVGEKLKGWAKWTFYVVAIVSIVSGIVCMCTIYDGIGFLVGIPVIILGILSARISSLILHGFGELVANSYNKGGSGKVVEETVVKTIPKKEEKPTTPNISEKKPISATKVALIITIGLWILALALVVIFA